MYEAARQTDQVAHTRWGFGLGMVAGALAGVVVGGAILVIGAPLAVTGVGAVAVFATASIAAGAVGGAVSGAFGTLRNNAGPIATGAPRVRIGGQFAARAIVDKLECDKGMVIAEGSKTVAIEFYPAARIGDKTECDGTISQGYPTVRIGREPKAYVHIRNQFPKWVRYSLGVLSIGMGFLQIYGFNAYRNYAVRPGPGAGGNGTASKFGSLRNMTRAQADAFLRSQGATVKTTKGGYTSYTFPDKSVVWIRPGGEVVRTPAPQYGPDGSRINNGGRLDENGNLTSDHNTGEKVK